MTKCPREAAIQRQWHMLQIHAEFKLGITGQVSKGNTGD